MSEQAQTLAVGVKRGIWRHFKNGFYWVSGETHLDENDIERVEYFELYGNHLKRSQPIARFLGRVEQFDSVPRFSFVCDLVNRHMLKTGSNVRRRPDFGGGYSSLLSDVTSEGSEVLVILVSGDIEIRVPLDVYLDQFEVI